MNNGASKNLTVMLLITVFITGASVLVIEIIGSRVLAPFFGSGIYTWSALIAITLGALALGYAIGGRLVDRHPNPKVLYATCFLAGLWTVATPWLASITLPSLVQLSDIRLGVLISCCLLFFPNLFLLGMVGPFVIRLLSIDSTTSGSVSGKVFSISTFGSLLAALATGFVLVPNFGVQQILFLSGITLILLAVTGFLILRKTMAGTFSLIMFAAAVGIQVNTTKTSIPELELLDSKPSFYGQLDVVRKYGIKALLIDGIGQNYVMSNGIYTTPYIDYMAAIPQLHQTSESDTNKSLVIGIGAGQLPMLLKQAGHEVEGVEIDPLIVDLAKEYFNFDMPEKDVHLTDGRLFLTRNTENYNYIFIDAFNGDQIAWHLLSMESLQLSRQHITEQGLLLINLTSDIDGEDVASVQFTLKAVFPYVKAFYGNLDSNFGSIVFLASSSPIHISNNNKSLSKTQIDNTKDFMAHELGILESGVLLTDNFNPISHQRLQVELHWRNSMREFLGNDAMNNLFL